MRTSVSYCWWIRGVYTQEILYVIVIADYQGYAILLCRACR